MTFEDFWQAWPAAHRVGKKQAVAQWQRLSAEARETAVLDVRARVWHSLTWQRPREDGRWMIPHPFRYLRDHRWEDAAPASPAVEASASGCEHHPPCRTVKRHAWRLVNDARTARGMAPLEWFDD